MRIGSEEAASAGGACITVVFSRSVVAGGGGWIRREGKDLDERTVAAHK